MRLFLFRLCKELKVPHPRYLLRYLTSHDIAEWMAVELIEPFGTLHQELLAGIIASEIANKNALASPTTETNPSDFMPSYDSPGQTPEAIQAVIRTAKDMVDGHRRET